jgi:hypothetical protein
VTWGLADSFQRSTYWNQTNASVIAEADHLTLFFAV